MFWRQAYLYFLALSDGAHPVHTPFDSFHKLASNDAVLDCVAGARSPSGNTVKYKNNKRSQHRSCSHYQLRVAHLIRFYVCTCLQSVGVSDDSIDNVHRLYRHCFVLISHTIFFSFLLATRYNNAGIDYGKGNKKSMPTPCVKRDTGN